MQNEKRESLGSVSGSSIKYFDQGLNSLFYIFILPQSSQCKKEDFTVL